MGKYLDRKYLAGIVLAASDELTRIENEIETLKRQLAEARELQDERN